jgi:hypothetical protein
MSEEERNLEQKWEQGGAVMVGVPFYSPGAAASDRSRGEKRPVTVEFNYAGYKAVKGQEEAGDTD